MRLFANAANSMRHLLLALHDALVVSDVLLGSALHHDGEPTTKGGLEDMNLLGT